MPGDSSSQFITQNRDAALAAGLAYVSTADPGILRRRVGRGFVYRTADQRRIEDEAVVRRIRALAVPPAWRDVWICTQPNGHIQAIGYDASGRRQYRYHDEFRALREGSKFEHMLVFAEALPALRARLAADMAEPGLGREKVLATVVHLLETTMARVGNRAYAKANQSFGLTTLRNRHVRLDKGTLRFQFKGKSGRIWRLGVNDRRVAKVVRACQDLPGQHLFQYLDDLGAPQAITSCDVNTYLKQVTGREITAKDFRTWAGTVLAAEALAVLEPPETLAKAKRALTAAVREVAARLGNTPAVCRASYIHPEIQSAFLAGELRLRLDAPAGGRPHGLRPEEAAVLAFLKGRTPGGGGGNAK